MSAGADDSPEALYREVIREHARAPCGRDRSIEATHRAEQDNPLCGDRIEVALLVEDGVIREAAFHGEGCAICLASASLLCTHLPGELVSAAAVHLRSFTAALGRAGERPDGDPAQIPGSADADCPAALRPLLPVAAWPARIDCATLPWQAAVEALSPRRPRSPAT